MSYDRLMSTEQGEEIIEQLNRIAEPKSMEVAVPIPEKYAFEYDGNEHGLNFYNIDDRRVNITGDIYRKNIGVYHTTCSLKDPTNCRWSDGTTASKTYDWQIDTLANITSFSKATYPQLRQLIEKADAGEIDLYGDCGWRVGDTRYITYEDPMYEVVRNEQFVLMDRCTDETYQTAVAYKDTEGNDRHHGSFVVGLRQTMYPKMEMRNSGTSSNWSNSYISTVINKDSFKSSFPKDLAAVMKFCRVQYAPNFKSSWLMNGSYYFWLPTINEVCGGSTNYQNSIEQQAHHQFEWYQTSSNKIKTNDIDGTSTHYWTRSVYHNDQYFDIVTSSGGNSYEAQSDTLGVSFNFII